eukprot:TRINITY_DN58639_c0_g1_i1.p1 TRINITY_DN58639_c0_g1~~TRINITY_DN58639_c0_g1_i1.p1  ORF type:complete len:133 (+),score=23.27 TRINITY_DN58639_c0_g1_i1:81-479(+)
MVARNLARSAVMCGIVALFIVKDFANVPGSVVAYRFEAQANEAEPAGDGFMSRERQLASLHRDMARDSRIAENVLQQVERGEQPLLKDSYIQKLQRDQELQRVMEQGKEKPVEKQAASGANGQPEQPEQQQQ